MSECKNNPVALEQKHGSMINYAMSLMPTEAIKRHFIKRLSHAIDVTASHYFWKGAVIGAILGALSSAALTYLAMR